MDVAMSGQGRPTPPGGVSAGREPSPEGARGTAGAAGGEPAGKPGSSPADRSLAARVTTIVWLGAIASAVFGAVVAFVAYFCALGLAYRDINPLYAVVAGVVVSALFLWGMPAATVAAVRSRSTTGRKPTFLLFFLIDAYSFCLAVAVMALVSYWMA